jgi:death-on-curing protein
VTEPLWLAEREALALHDRLLALHGGAAGGAGLCLAAIRPRQAATDSCLCGCTRPVRLATAYTAGIVHNHPFIDGNKRTGFVVGILFLELNGYRFTASEADAAQAVLELAAGTLDEAGYTNFLRANSQPAGS